MNQINWKITETEEDNVYVEFEINSKLITKLCFKWKGNENELMDSIEEQSINILEEFESKNIINDVVRRKLLPLTGSKNTNDVIEYRKNKKNALSVTPSSVFIEEI